MKIPGQLNFGVQQLGRPDTGAMRAKYNADQEASLAWGRAAAEGANQVAEISRAEGLADAQMTLSERVAMDKKSIGELDERLATTNAFNLDDEATPAAVRKAAERQGVSEGFIDTYKIAEDAARIQFDETRKASSAAIGEKGFSDKMMTSYNQQMDNVWAFSAKSATRTHVTQRLQHLSARAEMMYSDHINNLDEVSAMATIIEAEQAGIWTPELAAEKMNALGPTIDGVRISRMMRDVETQADLEEVENTVDTSRLTPEMRVQTNAKMRQLSNHLYEKSKRAQQETYADMQAELIRGNLTKAQVADAADSQRINGSMANTLNNALNNPTPLVSLPAAVDSLRGLAVSLRFPDPDGDPESVKKRAQKIREVIYSNFTGVGKNGPVDKTLTGEDLAKLIEEVDKAENIALGKGSIEHSMAIKQVRELSGYSDFVEQAIGKRHPLAKRHADMVRGLQDYMDANPGSADPLEWVARNSQLYSSVRYDKEYADNLAQVYPAYAEDIRAVVENNESAAVLLHRAQMDMLNGVLSNEAYRRLYRGLEYKWVLGGGDLSAEEASDLGAAAVSIQ